LTGAARPLTVVGNPSSAGSYAAGQEQAPQALRDAGVLDALRRAGREVVDAGDLPIQVWRPDRERPFVQNLPEVVDNLTTLRTRLVSLLSTDTDVLVLGGNCTGALACCAALRDVSSVMPTILYFDRHLDCNTPDSTSDGALDWMGIAHAFDLPGTSDALVEALGPRPLLTPDHVAFLGIDLDLATEWERRLAGESLHIASSAELAGSPADVVRAALAWLSTAPLIVHVDVDVLDFTDAPLSENTDGRNTGPSLDALRVALEAAQRQANPRILSVGELNPTRSTGDPDALPRFVSALAAVLAG
jgi:arginase